MKIGIAQINTTVGDLAGNQKKILHAYYHLCDQGAELIVFPELVVTGYPPRDLLFKNKFVSDNIYALKKISIELRNVPALLGFIDINKEAVGRKFFNAAAWCSSNKIHKIAHKCLLPTYDVFDDDRYFQSANEPSVIEFMGKKIGISICEDIWTSPELVELNHYNKDPVESLIQSDIDLLINLGASPWHFGKSHQRIELIEQAAKRCNCPVVYCNSIGGNDELIFDGHSLVVTPDSGIVCGLAGFAEESIVFDTESQTPYFAPTFQQKEIQRIHDALILGLRDYTYKSDFQKAILGLSGGVDSAVTAVLAVEALGKEHVIGVFLPSKYSSKHSQEDAEQLAKNLGIEFHSVPIHNIVEQTEITLEESFGKRPQSITEENIQSRTRGTLLMALSNKFNALLLTTGNKSELAVGYCTLYGDMCGGLAVISDLPKMRVYELANWINRKKEIIPKNTIDKPPSAELKPEQKDTDTIPPYELLDQILELYVEKGMSSKEIEAAGFHLSTVKEIINKVDLNEYKRRQAPPGLKITPLAFGVGRRIPIVQKYVN